MDILTSDRHTNHNISIHSSNNIQNYSETHLLRTRNMKSNKSTNNNNNNRDIDERKEKSVKIHTLNRSVSSQTTQLSESSQ